MNKQQEVEDKQQEVKEKPETYKAEVREASLVKLDGKDEEKKEDQKMKQILNRAQGCMMGALMGDASGAILEFAKFMISDKVVEMSLAFPGGGALRVSPAQVTDDGELTLSLARGLLRGKGKFSQYQILQEYGKWFKSPPFDIGNTTYTAFHIIPKTEEDLVKTVIANVEMNNRASQSNGCLMRCTPVPVWGYRLSDDEVFVAGCSDARLTHSDPVALQVVGLYCLTIKYLINGATRVEAYYKVHQYVEEKKLKVLPWFKDIIDIDKTEKEIVVNRQIGWLKIAFCYAMHYLKNEVSYRDALKDILKRGGDTDTNACIVGGLLGAYQGYSGLPEDMKAAFMDQKKVEMMRKKKRLVDNGYIAQEWGLKLAEELVALAPEKLEGVEE